MQISQLIPQDLWRYNKKTAKLWLPTSIASKQQQSNVLFIMTLWQCNFFKGHKDAPTIASKIYVKDPQTLSEVIRLVGKLCPAHQLTAKLTPSTVSMVSGDDNVLSVDGQLILAATALMPSIMAIINLAISPKTAPTKFLHQDDYATTEDFIQVIDTPHNWKDRSHSY